MLRGNTRKVRQKDFVYPNAFCSRYTSQFFRAAAFPPKAFASVGYYCFLSLALILST